MAQQDISYMQTATFSVADAVSEGISAMIDVGVRGIVTGSLDTGMTNTITTNTITIAH